MFLALTGLRRDTSQMASATITPTPPTRIVPQLPRVEITAAMAPTTAALAAVVAPGVRAAARAGITVVAAAAVAGPLAWGAQPPPAATDHVRAAVLARSQPSWAPDPGTPAGQRVLQSYVDAIGELPPDVRIAVLPEGAFGTDRARLATLTGPLSTVARAKDLDIVTGAIVKDAQHTYNTALDVSPSGAVVEYRKWRTGTSPNTPGHDLAYLAGRPIGLEVCMDVNGPDPSRDYGRADTGLLVIPASDEDADGWQHSRTAVLHGVESGTSVAWSAARGAPTIADSTGHVLAQTRTGRAPIVTATADVPFRSSTTLYARFGDWFAWLCTLTALAGLALAVHRTLDRPTR